MVCKGGAGDRERGRGLAAFLAPSAAVASGAASDGEGGGEGELLLLPPVQRDPSGRKMVDTSGSASSTMLPVSSSHPTLRKASAAEHVSPQRRHTARVSFPCSSMTFLLPAAV